MGWGKMFSNKGWGTQIARLIPAIVGTMVAGPVGGAIGGAIGGGIGKGGGLEGAATGGAMGGIGGLLSGGLGSAAGASMTGGMQGATQGSGLAGLLTGGGSNLGSILSGAGTASFGGGLSSLLGGGGSAGAPASAMSGFGGGSGGGSGAASLFGGGGSALKGLGSVAQYAMPASSLLSGYMQSNAQKKAAEEMLTGQREARAMIQPYNETGQAANQALAGKLASGELGGKFNALDLSSDPVYQSELAQGQQAIDRQASAGGNMFSGAALKAAADYSQQLAASKQNEAYNRWLGQQKNTYDQYSGQSAQGINAATGVGNYLNQGGNTRADAEKGQSNTFNETLANLLSGSGAIGQKKLVMSPDGKGYMYV